MKFAIQLQIWWEYDSYTQILRDISDYLEAKFESKTYGDSIKELVICISLNPAENSHLESIKSKYYKSINNITFDGITIVVEDAFEYNIILNSSEFLRLKMDNIQNYIIEKIVESCQIILNNKQVDFFDIDSFRKDLYEFSVGLA